MEPKLSFTLPSLHDDTTLDCRIYYNFDADDLSKTCPIRGAIIAHPYAPLGGCYDDPVVATILETILESHFGFVCTFNFRGVYGSHGHTSWTGKAEKADYESIVGFMVEFLRSIDINDEVFEDNKNTPVQLVLGGYSYGSWICTHLPSVADILKQSDSAAEGTTATEITTRAHHLANQTSLEIRVQCAESKTKHGHTLSVGGEETSPEKRRRSGESSPSRSGSHLRKSLDFARKIGSLRKKQYDEQVLAEADKSVEACITVEPPVSVAYLLVSPLLPPISIFTTLPFGSNALRGHNEETLQRLASNSTLAVFADNDAFTSVKKLRAWGQDLSNRPDSKFHYVEIENAGHFWRTHHVQKSLRLAVGHWVCCLMEGAQPSKGIPTPTEDPDSIES